MPSITIQNEGRTITVAGNSNLREALLAHKVGVYSGMSKVFNCHGRGRCGTCKVTVVEGSGNLTEVTPRERRKMGCYDRDVRLSCQCAIIGDAHVAINTS